MFAFILNILYSIICISTLSLASGNGIYDGSLTNIPIEHHRLENDRIYLDRVRGSGQAGYSMLIWLGTPPQKLRVILDTGSSFCGIMAAPSPVVKHYFHMNRSSTLEETNLRIDSSYVKGYWSGQLVSDMLHLGIGLHKQVRIQFAAITNQKEFFTETTRFDGILGLAYPSLAVQGNFYQKPVFNEIVQQAGIRDIFTLTYCASKMRKDLFGNQYITGGGFMTLGGIDNNLLAGPVFYTPIVEKYYYQFQLTNVLVDGQSIGFSPYDYMHYPALVDSGTSILRFPPFMYKRLMPIFLRSIQDRSVFSHGFFYRGHAVCMEESQLLQHRFPTIRLSIRLASFEKTNFKTPRQFTLVLSPMQYFILSGKERHGKPCYHFGIAGTSGAFGIILGDVVMKGFSVTFDRVNSMLGFAVSKCAGLKLQTAYSKQF
ncbi:uncharacterized protein TRIADDRAFT_55203 [Trichoplax adhaerens]|uniref:Peptidase A1 domain-containing protein n=1 Tax=Trichoplax adhaerens TaxID=10228 RepID=B3RU94_TRIAD|nr:hypothetical protein TRIADDRAFT_55203 [Trichoplax adhaerens]EDV25771.1 hypothetical protein TRIADDRAFT_55203 [Trichoplax adhaerens]|eukprot:XP_002111804.1 hypothetical protein TRIADDRAFT_55203 [Trichoplax adhaerens]